MKEKRFMYILTEDEKKAVKSAVDFFFSSVPYIREGIPAWRRKEKREFQALVDTLEALMQRMEGGASE